MKRLHRALVGLSLVVALGASLSALVPPAAGQSAAWTVPTGPVTVTYWDGVENVKNELMIKKLIPEYQKLHPNVTIKYETICAPLPAMRADRPATIVYSYNWAVNAKASEDQKKAAWDFIRYASGRPAEWMAVAKYLQPVKGWYETPAARQTPFLNVFIHDLSVGKPMPRTKHYTELQASLARMIERIIFNNADPKQALDQAAEEFTRASKS